MAFAPILIGEILDANPQNMSLGYIQVSTVMAAMNILCAVMIGFLDYKQHKKGEILTQTNNKYWKMYIKTEWKQVF